MKIRNGFVSNSSSSSFIIHLEKMTDEQKSMIYDHINIGKEIDKKLILEGKEPYYEYYEQWDVQEDDFALWCATSMTNFPLDELITEVIKIKREDIIEMGDGNWSRDIFTEEEYIKYKTDYLRRKKIEKIINK